VNIGILGAGNIGGTLGKKLAAAGHSVTFGVRDPASPKAKEAIGAGIPITTVREAATGADVVVIAVPWSAAKEVVESAGDLSGKIIVDTTNAFGGIDAGLRSTGEAIREWTNGGRVVKAFNSAGWEVLADPIFDGEPVQTFICGDDSDAKATAGRLAKDVGYDVIDIGGLENAALTENLARLWGAVAYGAGYGRNIAFKVVRR
jgi:predicted dinucleotide-binding enzyme